MASEYQLRDSGSGSQYSNTYGTQNNNSGSGNQFNADTINYNTQTQDTQTQSDAKLLADLRVTDPRDDKTRIERRKGGLLRDSYHWILDHEAFVRWQTDTQSSLLWIRGDPGKGKTMLICGIIDELPARMPGWETIYFFCEATDSRLNNATAVLRSLLYLLLRKRPALSRFIREEHEHAGKRLFEDANGWDVLDKTFTNIMQDGGLNDFILIVDALDECTTGLEQLLDFIVRLSSLNVKVIASSRNWLSIAEAVVGVSDQVCIKLELNGGSISAAVNRYISHKVDQLALRKKYNDNTRNYVYSRLSSKADDTFLWVALVTEQLGKPGVSERHARKKLEELPRELNALYERMLERTWESNDQDHCRRILAAVSIVYRPVTLLELMSLADLEEFRTKTEILETIVGECGSLLTVKDGIVYFVHQSAKDFLSGHALAQVMPSGMRHEHKLLLSRSLEVMSKTCRRNIYDLKEPGASLYDIRTPVPDPLEPARYACVYWLEHINDGGYMDEQQYSQVYEFLKQHFLHWIEALSLLESMTGGIASLFKLTRAIQSLNNSEQKLFVQDALRFIRYFRVAVETWPLQVYSSALVFSPMHSIIRKQFQNEVANWIIKQPVVDDEWSLCLQTLEGHDNDVSSLVFAPDGATLASASIDKTVKIWDTITGECLRTLQSDRSFIESIAFSLKGDKLVSASQYGIVDVWDVATGRLLNTFQGTYFMLPYWRVTFCGGDQQVAFGSQESVEVWDTVTGQRVRHFMCRQSGGYPHYLPAQVDFSADGALFASYTEAGQVAILDTGTGQILKTLDSEHSRGDSGTALAFSHDCTRLVTCHKESGLALWDTTTSRSIWVVKDGVVEDSVALSRDGRFIAGNSIEKPTIIVRDGMTGKVLHILPVFVSTAVAFSLDGTQLFLGSPGRLIGIWDLTSLQKHRLNETGMLESDFPSTATSLTSHDTTKADCTAAEDLTVATNYAYKSITALTFSHDGKQLASWAPGSFTIWDFITGRNRKISCNTTHPLVISLAYSRSGILSAAAPLGFILIMDPATGCVIRQIDVEERVEVLCFSKDGATLASLQNKCVKLWDSATGDCKVTFLIPEMVRQLRFSESGSQLITPIGILNLESLSNTGAGMSTPQTLEMMKSPQGFMLSGDDGGVWLQKDYKPILWVPPEYRESIVNVGSLLHVYGNIGGTSAFAVRGSAVALGCPSGRVLMMEFSSDL